MREVAKVHQDKLEDMKDKVKDFYEYFRNNFDRYHEYMSFVFSTSLTDTQRGVLTDLQRPIVEFNVTEAVLDQVRGEFAKHEPGIVVHASDTVPDEAIDDQFLAVLKVVESYVREKVSSKTTDSWQMKVFRDVTGGGFSVVDIYTDYLDRYSFHQDICVERACDVTLTFFDPLAKDSHKGDGEYCGKLYPITKEEAERRYGEELTKKMLFARSTNIGDFNWSYMNGKQKILLICEFYRKECRDITLAKLSDGQEINKKHYDDFLKEWAAQGFVEQAPVIVEERDTEIEEIWRYTFCESKVLKAEKTDFKYLPLVFFDGDSVDLRKTSHTPVQQMTRPLVYHIKGLQQLINLAGQGIAHEIEKLSQQTLMASVEAVPEKYLSAYTDPQKASVLLYNQFYEGNPATRLDPPQIIQRPATPPILETTFYNSDRMVQRVLGVYDGLMAQNRGDVSGQTIENSSITSSLSAMPWVTGYINGLNRVGEILIDLFPKYIKGPRRINIRDQEGRKATQTINNPNNPNSIDIKYDSKDLKISVSAGVNSELQKMASLDMLTKMCQAMPGFGAFIETMGLETVLDNMTIRGIEALKELAIKYNDMRKKAAEENANKTNPEEELAKGAIEVEMAKVMQRKQEAETQAAIDAAKVAIEKQKADAQVAKLLSDVELSESKMIMEQERIDGENARDAVKTAIEIVKSRSESDGARIE